MSFKILVVLLPALIFATCTMKPGKDNTELAKQEILETEQAFAEMATSKGIRAAFLHFAAPDAVLHRRNKLHQGRDAIGAYFDSQELKEVTLTWEPSFVDASASGELGYTYGKYEFSALGNDGERISDQGIFHTVWKKQPGGSWRFVWD